MALLETGEGYVQRHVHAAAFIRQHVQAHIGHVYIGRHVQADLNIFVADVLSRPDGSDLAVSVAHTDKKHMAKSEAVKSAR